MNLNLTLTQADLNTAISDYIAKQGVSTDGAELEIKIKAGTGGRGGKATAKGPSADVVVIRGNAERTAADAEDALAEIEAEEAASEEVVEAETSTEAVDSEPAGALFGNN